MKKDISYKKHSVIWKANEWNDYAIAIWNAPNIFFANVIFEFNECYCSKKMDIMFICKRERIRVNVFKVYLDVNIFTGSVFAFFFEYFADWAFQEIKC